MCVCGRRLDGCAVVGLQQPPILASGSEAEDLKKLDDSYISYYRAHNCAASSRAEDEHTSDSGSSRSAHTAGCRLHLMKGKSAFPLCAVLGGVVHDLLAERLELLARERLGEEVGEVLEALDVLDLDLPGLDELANLELLAQDVLRLVVHDRVLGDAQRGRVVDLDDGRALGLVAERREEGAQVDRLASRQRAGRDLGLECREGNVEREM